MSDKDISTASIQNLSHEDRHFDPPQDLAASANLKADAYDRAADDRLGFWAEQAERISWGTPFTEVLDWSNPPFAKWFIGGTLNASYNCVDRHVEAGKGDKVALHWVGEPADDTRDITYAELKDEVSRAANALDRPGPGEGRPGRDLPADDPRGCRRDAGVCSPRRPPHGGLRRLLRRRPVVAHHRLRRQDRHHLRRRLPPRRPCCAQARRRRGAREVPRRHPRPRRQVAPSQDVEWNEGRDVWWHDVVDSASADHTPEMFDSEHPLYVMYTSGTTGKPKGILHTTGGYMVGCAYTYWSVFDTKPETDIYWCTADVGWVTGHSYIVYGPLANGVTQVMYEGTPDTPHKGRWWEIIQDLKVTQFYTAPTAIRTFMKWGEQIPADYDLSSLRLLGSVGESINPEAYMWYREHIGGDNAPIVDTWWQTETGAIMISPLPGVTSGKPGSAMTALPGISADVVDDAGKPVGNGEGGYLVVTEPWPSMLRTIWGDDERFKETYWSRFKNMYFAGDGAKKDDDGDIWLMGRVDDVMNVSGHRLSTTEIESALVSHPKVAEAAVVGATDDMTGQAPVAFVILRESAGDGGEDVVQELRNHVAKEIGAIAKPKKILIVAELPKTRSGKIMRRLLRDVAENRDVGDATTLADSSVMDLISSGMKTAKDED